MVPYTSNGVSFIQKYLYLAKLRPKNRAHAHIWAYVFGHNSAISGPIGLEFFYGSSGDHYLSIGYEEAK